MSPSTYAVDLHTHSRFFHGFPSRPTPFDPIGAELLERVAARLDLDGVAVTNHDYARRVDFDDLVAIPGIEVSTTKGHVLVVGPDPPTATKPGWMEPAEVAELAAARDCATVMAHPFRNSTVRGVDVAIDAVEINGKHQYDREWVEQLAERRGVPIVGGSDAHYPVGVGRAYTTVTASELTPESVVAAIRDGRVEARTSSWPVHGFVRRAYRAVHRRKGQITPPEDIDRHPLESVDQ